jgi:hypothetical protein
VGLKSLKSLNLTNGYPNKNKNSKNKNKNKVKSKPLELFELVGKNLPFTGKSLPVNYRYTNTNGELDALNLQNRLHTGQMTWYK